MPIQILKAPPVPTSAGTQLALFRERKDDARGGKRRNAGRPPVIPGRQAHGARPLHAQRFPVHATLKVRRDVPRLRHRHIYAALRAAFRKGASRPSFRMVHYSVQGNHLHLLCEADDNTALSRGMQGLAIRVARGISKTVGRTGKVFFDRYFAKQVRSPFQMRRALVYVLNNPHFVKLDAGERVCPPARTWLLTVGWERHGKLRFGERPAARV